MYVYHTNQFNHCVTYSIYIWKMEIVQTEAIENNPTVSNLSQRWDKVKKSILPIQKNTKKNQSDRYTETQRNRTHSEKKHRFYCRFTFHKTFYIRTSTNRHFQLKLLK